MNEKVTPSGTFQVAVRSPAPVGTAPAIKMNLAKASALFADTINHHLWTATALDVFESHSFTGHPGEARWCSRCTLALPAEWKKPGGPLPPKCGSPKVVAVPAMYSYARDDGAVTLRPVDANYAGAKVVPDTEPDA